MNAFDLEAPDSLHAALHGLDPDDASVRVIAGGTALMLMMKAGVFRPSRLISLHAIEKQFSSQGQMRDGGFRIGSMVTLSDLEQSADLTRFAPVMRQALRTLSNVRVRNVATIGGHLAHADPHMDLPPVLIALGAVVHATSRRGGRHIPVQDLYTGYYETALARDELIDEIVIPPQRQRYSSYVKFSTRAVHDWPAVGVAVSFGLVDNLAHDARVVVSAATERPIRAMAAEQALNGHPIDAAGLRRAASAAADTIETIGDARGSRAYKKQLVGVHVERALHVAAGTVGVAQQ